MAWCFSTRASVATVLTMHPCVSQCLRVKRSYYRNELINFGNCFALNEMWTLFVCSNADEQSIKFMMSQLMAWCHLALNHCNNWWHSAIWYWTVVNTWGAEFYLEKKKKINLHFLSFLDTEMAQVVGIIPRGRQGPVYPAQLTLYVLNFSEGT